MSKGRKSFFIFLFFLTLLTRIPFRSEILYSWDSIQFALASYKFDVSLYQPHPPGYILYVILGKGLNYITDNPNLSFFILNLIFSALTLIILFYLTERIFKNSEIALWTSIIFLSSPLFWFAGEVSLPYVMESFFSSLFALICFEILSGKNYYTILGVILALAGGVRQNLLIFLGPLYFYTILLKGKKIDIIKSIFSFICIFLLWYIPTFYFSGGFKKYHRILSNQFDFILNYSIFREGIFGFYLNFKKVLNSTIFSGLGCFSFVIFLYLGLIFENKRKKQEFKKDNFPIVLFLLWILPSFLFYSLIFIDPSSYVLTFLPALFIIFGNLLSKISSFISENSKTLSNSLIFSIISIFIILGNIIIYIIFFQTGVKKTNFVWINIENYIREKFKKEETLILTSFSKSEKYNYFRHSQYYLTEYKTYFLPDIGTKNHHKENVCTLNRKTILLDEKYINLKTKTIKIPEKTKFIILLDNNLQKFYKGEHKINKIKLGNYLFSFIKINKEKNIIFSHNFFMIK